MVDGIATGQTLDLDDEDTLPEAALDLLQELLHDGPGGNRFAGNDLAVYLRHVEVGAFGKLKEELFVPGQRFALTVGLGLKVGAGLSQVQAVLHELSPPL